VPNMKQLFIFPNPQLPSIVKDLDTYVNNLDPLLLGVGICLLHLMIYALLFKSPQINKQGHPSVIAMGYEARLLAEATTERKQSGARPRARRALRTEMQEQLYRVAQRSTLGPQSGNKRKRSENGKSAFKKARLGFILEDLVV